MVSKKSKKKTSFITPNRIIVASLVWLIVWIIILVSSDIPSLLSAYFATKLLDNSSGWPVANTVMRIPLIAGCFTLAYGIGAKTEDKWGTAWITLLLGALLSWTIIPVFGYVNFMINYTW